MISVAGRGLMLIGLFFAAAGSVSGYAAGRRGDPDTYGTARLCAWAFAVSTIGANLLMVYALLVNDFSVSYVAQVGSLSSPVYIRVLALWSSLEGSILFWAGVLGAYTAGLLTTTRGGKHQDYLPYTLHVLLAVAVFFCLLVSSVADPFRPTPLPIPTDGPGPNPLLQNHWLMAVHPPMLYTGYVGMSVPFAMMCAALLEGRLDAGWMAPLRRWMLLPWIFLSVGIVLGAWWAYAVLGWGGYWAWDPVENASFHPWLTGTAFLHSAMVLQRRNRLRDWTLALGMSTFLLTLVGTFMTRSGIFNSVHSFTQSDIGPVFLVFLAICFVYSVVLLATRGHLLAENSPEVPAVSLFDPLGREFSILVQNAVFTVFAFTVFLGTTYPLVAEALDGRRLSVGGPYFERWALPLGTLLVFLMGVGPSLPWGKVAPQAVLGRIGPPTLGGIVCAGLFAAAGFTGPISLLALFVCGYALVANGTELLHPLASRARQQKEPLLTALGVAAIRTRRRFGAHISHFGIAMAVVAIALSRGYKVERDYTLAQGETVAFEDYLLTFESSRLEKQPHRDSNVARFAVTRGGRDIGPVEPRLNQYRMMREPIGTPGIESSPSDDLYLSLLDLKDGHVTVRAMRLPGVAWLWFAGGLVALGAVIAAWPSRRKETA